MTLNVTDSAGKTERNRSDRAGAADADSGANFTNQITYVGFEILGAVVIRILSFGIYLLTFNLLPARFI
jgi:hypothetical protein